MRDNVDHIPSTRVVYIRSLVGCDQLTEARAQASITEYEEEPSRILEETRGRRLPTTAEDAEASADKAPGTAPAGFGSPAGEEAVPNWVTHESQLLG